MSLVKPVLLFLVRACCERGELHPRVSAVGGGEMGREEGGKGLLPITVCNLVCVINVGTAAPAPHNYGFIPLCFPSSAGASDTGGL